MRNIFQLQLLEVKPRLEYLPPRATLISSAADHPKREVHAVYNIHPSYFSLYSTQGKHTQESQNCEIKRTDSGTVPRTLQGHR